MAHQAAMIACFGLMILQGGSLAARDLVEGTSRSAPQAISQKNSYAPTTSISGAPAQGPQMWLAPALAPTANPPSPGSLGGQSNSTVDSQFIAAVSAALSTIERRIDARMDAANRIIVDLVCARYWIIFGMIMFVYILTLLLAMPQINRWYGQWCARKVSPEPVSTA